VSARLGYDDGWMPRMLGCCKIDNDSAVAAHASDDPPPPVQHGGWVKLARYQIIRKGPLVLRTRAGCGDRPEVMAWRKKNSPRHWNRLSRYKS
jgi:hypothetical protein